MRRAYPILLTLLFAAKLTASSFLVLTAMPDANPYGPVGFLPASLNAESVNVICLDYSSTTYIGDVVEVNMSLLVPGGLGMVRFGTQPENLQLYQSAALMMHAMRGAGDADVAAYQYAIWNLFRPGAVNLAAVPNAQSYFDYYFSLTADDLNKYTYDDIRIDTPVDRHEGGSHPNAANQEFMAGDVGQVPEPATMVLLGSALLAGSVALRRKLTKGA